VIVVMVPSLFSVTAASKVEAATFLARQAASRFGETKQCFTKYGTSFVRTVYRGLHAEASCVLIDKSDDTVQNNQSATRYPNLLRQTVERSLCFAPITAAPAAAPVAW
jgi:hypothetical protein